MGGRGRASQSFSNEEATKGGEGSGIRLTQRIETLDLCQGCPISGCRTRPGMSAAATAPEFLPHVGAHARFPRSKMKKDMTSVASLGRRKAAGQSHERQEAGAPC